MKLFHFSTCVYVLSRKIEERDQQLHKSIDYYLVSNMIALHYVTDPSLRQVRRRSSASEKAKEIEAINGIVSGKNVLITGGAAGLGYAFLNHFLKHGANVSSMIQKPYKLYNKINIKIKKKVLTSTSNA